MMKMKIILFTFFLAISCYFLYVKINKLSTQSNERDVSISSYANADDINIKNLEFITYPKNQVIPIQDLSGQLIIIHFWASWCAPCVEEIPSLGKMLEILSPNVDIIALSVDSSQEDLDAFLKAFPQLLNGKFVLSWDNKKEWMKYFRVQRLPESFLFSKEGRLIKKIAGSVDWNSKESIEFLKQSTKDLN